MDSGNKSSRSLHNSDILDNSSVPDHIRPDRRNPSTSPDNTASYPTPLADDLEAHQSEEDRQVVPQEEFEQGKSCFVCLDSAPNAILLECGHGGLCVACAERLWQRGRRCPLCRAGFAGVVRIVDADAAVV